MPTEAPRPPEMRHQLVFNGEVLRGFDPLTTRCMVQRALKLDAAACAHLFSGNRLVLLRDVPPARARHYIEQFARMGAVLRAEAWASVPMPGAAEAPSPVAAGPAAPRPRGWRRLGYAGATAALAGGLLAAGLPGTASPGRAPAAVSVVAEPAGAAVESSAGEPAAARAFAAEYLGAAGHKAFAVAAGGSYGWTAGAATAAQAQEAALAACDGRREPYAPPCAVIDVNGRARR